MNKIINKFLFVGDKFKPEMHLRQAGFTYSICRPFTKNKQKIQKFKETGDSRYIDQTKLDRPCFHNDMAYEDYKDLPRRIAADKVLYDKAFNIAKNPSYDSYERGLALMVHQFFGKKSSGNSFKIKYMSNQELAVEIHKPIIRKFEN